MGYLEENQRTKRDLHSSMPRSAGYTNPGPTELCREREIQERHSITGGKENEGSEQAGASESTHAWTSPQPEHSDYACSKQSFHTQGGGGDELHSWREAA